MDKGAWQATVHGVAKSQTQLSDKHLIPTVENSVCNSGFHLYLDWEWAWGKLSGKSERESVYRKMGPKAAGQGSTGTVSPRVAQTGYTQGFSHRILKFLSEGNQAQIKGNTTSPHRY